MLFRSLLVTRASTGPNGLGACSAGPQARAKGGSAARLAAVAAQKDISLVELAELLRTEHGASFGASTVWRCLDRHGMTFKKNSARRRAEAARRGSPAPGLVRSPA